MKWLRYFTFIIILGAPQAQAQNSVVKSLAQIFAPYVYAITRPTYVYNWWAAPESALKTSASDPAGYQDVQLMASRYWQHQTDPRNTNDMFGTGLYVAVDPVSTRSFGGNNMWLLTQIVLPTGFKILDINRDGGLKLSDEQFQLVEDMGCPADWKNEPLLETMMNPENYKSNLKCAASIRELFQNQLGIDAFAYSYDGISFKQCDLSNPAKEDALVIISAEKIRPENVRIFDHLTTDDVTDRIRIQAMFNHSNNLDTSNYLLSSKLATFLRSKGYSEQANWPVLESDNVIIQNQPYWKVTICNPQSQGGENSCFVVTMPMEMAKPETLWKDLGSEPSEINIGPWMRENLFGCALTPPYIEDQDFK